MTFYKKKNENPCRAPKVIIFTSGAAGGAGRRAYRAVPPVPPPPLAPPIIKLLTSKYFQSKSSYEFLGTWRR